MDERKLLSIFVFLIIIFLVANLVLFALRIISSIMFWVIIIVAAVFSYRILPKLIKKIK